MLRVLVLDANQRAALAVVRSLGQRGLQVTTADVTRRTLAGASRFASSSLVHPNPQENPTAFLGWLDQLLGSGVIDAIVPVTEISTDLVLRNRGRWPAVLVPFAPIELVDELSDKVQLYQLAQALGLPVPRSFVVTGRSELARAAAEIGFPCILKPHRSRILVGGRWVSTTVRRADDMHELESLLSTDAGLQHWPLLYQEFVPGHGAGVFALYQEGKPRLWFAHRRLREKPPSGGVSVLSESVAPPADLVVVSQKLLDHVAWEGPAMVEYRIAPNGAPYLMEINARFWGSLQLAIDAGADFPSVLFEPHTPDLGAANAEPLAGKRLRWLLGDVDRLWLQFKRRNELGIGGFLKELLNFFAPDLSGRTRHETFRWKDPAPALHEFLRYVRLI